MRCRVQGEPERSVVTSVPIHQDTAREGAARACDRPGRQRIQETCLATAGRSCDCGARGGAGREKHVQPPDPARSEVERPCERTRASERGSSKRMHVLWDALNAKTNDHRVYGSTAPEAMQGSARSAAFRRLRGRECAENAAWLEEQDLRGKRFQKERRTHDGDELPR